MVSSYLNSKRKSKHVTEEIVLAAIEAKMEAKISKKRFDIKVFAKRFEVNFRTLNNRVSIYKKRLEESPINSLNKLVSNTNSKENKQSQSTHFNASTNTQYAVESSVSLKESTDAFSFENDIIHKRIVLKSNIENKLIIKNGVKSLKLLKFKTAIILILKT